MDIAVKNGDTISVSDATFARPFSEGLVHQVVTAYLAGGRAGTKGTKNRSAVRGGGRKPWRQKGTGRARAGSIRSPIWRGGGHTFALRPRDFGQKVNKKMFRGALQAILSELVRQERFHVVSEFSVDKPKTKLLAEQIGDYQGRTLIVLADVDEDVFLAARNLPHVEVIDVAALDPVALVGADDVIATVAAVQQIEERLG